MPFWELVSRVLGAVLALALVLASAWLLLRWINRRIPGMSGGSGRLIQVLDRVSAGRNGSLMLIRIKEKVMLIGISDNHVEKLCEFDDPDETMKLPTPQDLPSFTDALKDAAKKFTGHPKDGGDAP